MKLNISLFTVLALMVFAIASCMTPRFNYFDSDSAVRFNWDLDNEGVEQKWHTINFNDADWNTIGTGKPADIPETASSITGWYRTTFTVPESQYPQTSPIYFYAQYVDRKYSLYVNGEYVGKNGSENGSLWYPTQLDITRFVNRDEENLLAIKVTGDTEKFGLNQFFSVLPGKHIIPLDNKFSVYEETAGTSERFFDDTAIKTLEGYSKIANMDKRIHGNIMYECSVRLSDSWKKSKVFLSLPDASSPYQLLVNNKVVRERDFFLEGDNYINLSPFLLFGEDNIIRIKRKFNNKPASFILRTYSIYRKPLHSFSPYYQMKIANPSNIPVITGSENDIHFPYPELDFYPLSRQQYLDARTIVARELAKYPPRLLRKTINSIVIAEGIYSKQDRSLVGGISSIDIIIQFTNWDSEFVKDTIHHEIGHRVQNSYMKQFDQKAWMAANPEGFEYSSDYAGFFEHGDRTVSVKHGLKESGFIYPYSQVNIREDFANFFEIVFSKGGKGLDEVQSTAALRQKYKVFIKFLHDIDPSLTEEYLETL